MASDGDRFANNQNNGNFYAYGALISFQRQDPLGPKEKQYLQSEVPKYIM